MSGSRCMPRCVYVASDGSGLHKIGMSRDPEARCRSLTQALGRQVQMLFSTPITPNGRAVEEMSHSALSDRHQGNEWFSVNADVAIAAVEKAFQDSGAVIHDATPVPLDREPLSPLQVRAKRAGLQQKRLAALLGVSENTVSLQLRGKWESGTPRYVTATIIAWEIMSHDDRMRWLEETEEVSARLKRPVG